MAQQLSSLFLTRLVLPLSLGACAVLRQNLFSFLYLVLLLCVPLVKTPTMKTMAGATGRFLMAVMVISVLTTVAQISFQIVLFSMPPYGHFLDNCELLEKILRHIGLVKLDHLEVYTGVRMMAPEVIMLVSSITVYILCSKVTKERRPSHLSDVSTPSTAAILPQVSSSLVHKKHLGFLVSLGKYLTVVSLCVAGAIRPSIPGAVYFLVFLGAMTWWACYKELGRAFAVVLRCTLGVVTLHILALFAVQVQWVQESLPSGDCNYCRYLGLTVLVTRNCTNPVEEHFAEADWDSYVNPVFLLWLFYILVIESRLLLRPRTSKPGRFHKADSFNGPLSRQISVRLSQRRMARSSTQRWRSATRRVRLIRAMSPQQSKYTTGDPSRSPSSIHQDAHGSVTITDGYEDVIQLHALGTQGDGLPPTGLCDKLLDCVLALFQFISRSSYVATSITMMAWSITYHSWLTFVLLLWASVLWIVPNQRRSMLRCSPFLVFYALFLLLSQYIYSMDLTEAELPQKVEGFNLKQIGFVKALYLPIRPILVKSLYTIMFWTTLRQFMQERFEQRSSSTLEDMVAPLQITVGAATRGFSMSSEPQPSPFMTKLGACLQAFFTKFWIWVVAIMLFGISFVGTRMTVLRIIYMALFLVFILTFQVSYQFWRKMMYAFWLTVILYSMSILVLIYTYQFDNFPEYWEVYLGVPKNIQQDLGLETYQTGDLFVRLLSPAFFLVITVIQLHYYHKDFLAISDIKSRSMSAGRASQGSNNYKSEGSAGPQGAEPDDPTDVPVNVLPSLRTLKHVTKAELVQLMAELKSRLGAVVELFWCFLELHLIKIMMLSVVLMCVYDVCALHLLLVVLVVAAMSFGRNVLMVVTHIVSVLISLLLLTNMIYQIDFFKHDEYNVNCTDTHLVPSPPEERPLNDADWVGLQKTSKIRTLPDLLKGYIGLIVLATILAVVDIRQMYRRHMDGACLMRPTVIFPQIQRVHTDDNIKSCLMFLFNYGFYKFGVEVSLVMTVILIGSRMDVYAVLYGLWLCILFALKRETIARVWGFFQLFIIIVIPIQYAMAVGLPPGLCIEYPWYETDLLRRLQEWMYLPDPLHSPPSYKLLCDFILLAFVCRQSVVFRIERRYSSSQDYPGGSNRDITKECEEPGFINPVPDFITFTRSWLDVVKRVVFQVSLWVTLGLVFLAGTNRVNVFSLGYLVGTFVFLWQGEEMYLIPVQVIVRRWNVLLGYNVGVIMVKTALQIVGCVFIKEAQTHACWVVQLLGIGCIKKFGDITAKLGIAAPTECNIPRDHVGLAWDGVCFAALILMRRLFRSYYFIRLVDETKAMTVLASRGAELIEELRLSRIMEQQEQERQILEKIKMKMERIKATQQKIQGALFKEPDNHFVEGDDFRPPQYRRKIYTRAIRSGDYYMFEELDDVDLDEEKDVPDSDVLNSTESKRVTLSKFLSTAMKTDMEQAADLALAQPQPRSRTSTIAGVTATSDLQAAPRRSSVPLPPPRRQSSSFSTAQTRVTPPSPSLHSDYQLEPSPAESKDSYESVEGRRVKPGDHKAPDHSPPSSDPGSVSELDRPTKPPDEETNVWTKIWMYIKFIWAFLESAMVTITKYLNRNSRDYRYVVRMLALEKKMLKEDSDFGKGTRNGPSMVWQPLPSLLDHKKLISRNSAAAEGDSSDSSQQLEVDLVTMKTPRLDQPQARSSPVHSSEDLLAAPVGSINRLTEESQGVPEIRLVAPSLERGLDYGSGVLADESDSDSQHELSAADQPPIVQLCIAIYYSLMSHSELICYFMVFLHQIKSATILSLPLPLMVFLWGTLTVPRPTKTFWVTLIAYTETIVVVKCLFQFDLIPWNIRPILDNQPFFPPRIIGIEQKPNYATYDLALLLIIFFHRVMLKSMGLWKSSYEDPIRFPKKEEMFALDSSGSDEQQTKAGEEFSDLQPSKLCLRRGSAGSKSSSVRQVVTQGGRRLSAIRSVEDLEGETSTDLPTTQLVVVETERESALVHFPAIIKLATVRYFDSIRKFFENLMVPSSRVTADVYTYMFLCDFFNFLVVVVGIESFGTQQGDGGVTAYLEENKVPIPFLLMLILQFALIVIDRALYLRKHILGKIVFQFLLVVGIHIWMFFILPGITERQFNAALPPQMWYMVKSFYLLLSAYQIRCGYPTRILGNVLCKRYNILNYVLFKGYLLVPFLFELRTIMDWVWTNTTMTLMDWLKMEDIFNNIFQHKCARRMESEYPQPRGERKNPTVKYLMGGGALVVIIGILWFPLVLFALGNTVGKPNLPYDVTLSLRIGPYQPVYTMSAQNNSIYRLSDQQWTKMANAYKSDRVAQTFLSGYDSEDVGVVALGGNSTSVWGISPPDMDRLILEVASANPIVFKLAWKVSRASNNPEVSGVTEETREWVMEAVDSAGNRNPQREVLANMLARVNSSTTKAIIVQDVLPKFVKVTNRNTVPAVKQLMGEDGENEVSAYRNLSIRLYHDSKELWWELKEAGCDNPVPSFLKTLPFFSGCKQLVIYTFNEKAFPAGLSIISGGGIIALYTGIVLLVWKASKGITTGMSFRIMYEDLPYVDRILQLCLDIYLVRESGEFALEEDLFAKLVFLYRSPETLIKWSRPPEEGEEEAEGERPAIAQ